MSAPLTWRDALIAAAANARGRIAGAPANGSLRNADEQRGMEMMAEWLAADFEYAASMAPHEGAAYVRKMGTAESRALSAEKGKPTQGYGARRARKVTP